MNDNKRIKFEVDKNQFVHVKVFKNDIETDDIITDYYELDKQMDILRRKYFGA